MAKRKKLTRQTKPVPEGYVKCSDCGATHKQDAPHYMFCEARTCTRCGVTFTQVIQPNDEGERICDDCLITEDGDVETVEGII